MNITYVAKHDQPNSNDDEGAITHALEALGHRVLRIQETEGHWARKSNHRDLLLFHKWSDPNSLATCRGRFDKTCCWYFDLVDWSADPTLARRCQQRKEWMATMLPLVDRAFCTDGDWANKVGAVWLPQGADERTVGRGDPRCPTCGGKDGDWPPILFTGVCRGGGRERVSFVEDMRARWGAKFQHVEYGVHGRAMADLIARSKVVVAPDSPVTDRYCSNRVWNALGFGAFLLHPWTAMLERLAGTGLMCYRTRDDLHGLIADYLELPVSRGMVSEAGLEAVKREHLYRHRCERLLKETFR